ncbi:hypothetical protein KC963_05205 [Candidatus Saccharibacteria bacterium]|nr:hypothetical protein [Candidatus Saccharibacteria bacterium]
MIEAGNDVECLTKSLCEAVWQLETGRATERVIFRAPDIGSFSALMDVASRVTNVQKDYARFAVKHESEHAVAVRAIGARVDYFGVEVVPPALSPFDSPRPSLRAIISFAFYAFNTPLQRASVFGYPEELSRDDQAGVSGYGFTVETLAEEARRVNEKFGPTVPVPLSQQ